VPHFLHSRLRDAGRFNQRRHGAISPLPRMYLDFNMAESIMKLI
jgi:hypothetical protein